jgi:hypothetical protein
MKEIISPLVISYKLGITNPTPLTKNLALEIYVELGKRWGKSIRSSSLSHVASSSPW